MQRPTPRETRRSVLVLLLCSALASADASAGVSPAAGDPLREWIWRRLSVPVADGDGLAAVAVDRSDGRTAIGTRGMVALRSPRGGTFRRVARVAAVGDLHFDASGALWIGGLGGLWSLSPEGQLDVRTPAPGEVARAVHRIASRGDVVAVATEGGAFVSRDGRSWQRVRAGLPPGPVRAVALRAGSLSGELPPPSPDSLELLALAAGRLWRVELVVEASGLRIGAARLVEVAGQPATEPVDLVLDFGGAEIAVVHPRALAVLRGGWRVLRPALPPGASARRAAVGAGALWLATDRGLLAARELEGPWRRAGSPAGSAPARGLSTLGDRVWVATASGLLEGSVGTSGAPALTGELQLDTGDPDIRAVQQAALRHTGLGPERMRALRRGVDRAGWLPEMSVSLGIDRGRARRRDADQSFVSGDTRHLLDRQDDRSFDFDSGVVLSWDLGQTAYHPEALDLSREERAVIALRDDVLDEVNQLYFERRALLIALESAPEPGSPEENRMRLRAAELAAGLDGWTGGWFSQHSRSRRRRPRRARSRTTPSARRMECTKLSETRSMARIGGGGGARLSPCSAHSRSAPPPRRRGRQP